MNEREAESDEDCEVYFLKPVNEYNIVDKIKEANKELFADTETDKVDEIDVATIRKVTFALNLEDYEPTTKPISSSTSTTKIKDEVMINKLEVKLKTTEVECFTIKEEEETEAAASVEEEIIETESNETDLVNVEPQPQTEETAAEPMTEIVMEATDLESIPDEDREEDTEDILEDILIMDAEENAAPAAVQKTIVKQTTFDYDEQDRKSLTNLFIYENESDDAKQSSEDVVDSNDDDEDEAVAAEEDDDDDDLSIIVASYLPDNFDIYNRDFETSNNQDATLTKTKSSSAISLADNKTLKQHVAPSTSMTSFFNTKNFSFRRTNSNSASNLFEKPQQTQLHVPELKFNYKTCCEFRNAIQDNLPKYTGYLSEYGLSREQLLQREQQLKRKKRSVLEQSLKTNEDELRKMQDNERAFTTWLKNKIKFPINKTRNMFDVKARNMFDVKLRRNSVATNATAQSANCNKHGCMHSRFQ